MHLKYLPRKMQASRIQMFGQRQYLEPRNTLTIKQWSQNHHIYKKFCKMAQLMHYIQLNNYFFSAVTEWQTIYTFAKKQYFIPLIQINLFIEFLCDVT